VQVRVNGKTKSILSEKLWRVKPEDVENNPHALGIIQRLPRLERWMPEMAPVNLADITSEYDKDFSHLTKCPA
jgi:diphthamide biosynthesis methyltransferase